MTLAELKAKAAELGLTPDAVRSYGSLAKKATWEAAITEKENTIASAQSHQPEVVSQELAVSSEASYITSEAPHIEPESVQPSAILPFRPTLTQLSKPDNSGYLVWSQKVKRWIKENPAKSSTPIRDKLLAKMMGYVDKGISLADLEEMQKSSPDEKTAAIYLAILEESERLLIEAVAA